MQIQAIKCIGKSQTYYLCSSADCIQKSPLCQNNECQCKNQHQNCRNKLEINEIIRILSNKLNWTRNICSSIIRQIQSNFCAISKQIKKQYSEFKQWQKFIGLNDKQVSLITDSSKLQGRDVHQVQINSQQARENDIQPRYEIILDNLNISLKQIKECLKNNNFSTIQKRTNLLINDQKLFRLINTPIKTSSGCFGFGQSKKAIHLSDHNHKLIFRASQMGFESRKFHQKCDQKNNTLTIIKGKIGDHEQIFGGYTPLKWKITQSLHRQTDKSKNSFLFNLTNQTKILLQNQNEAIVNYPVSDQNNSSILSFGNDLRIIKQQNEVHAILSIGKSYSHSKQNKIEKRTFKIVEWEVYKVQVKVNQ